MSSQEPHHEAIGAEMTLVSSLALNGPLRALWLVSGGCRAVDIAISDYLEFLKAKEAAGALPTPANQAVGDTVNRGRSDEDT